MAGPGDDVPMQDVNTSPDSLDAALLAHLQTWQGRTEIRDDVLTAAPVSGLSATLDRDDAPPRIGTVLPPLWHWLYYLPQPRQSEIGPDGHPRRGGFLPPVPLPRRMWAGGRLRWEAGNPLQVGQQVQRTSAIQSVRHKAGRTGDLVFVQVEHQFRNAQGLALTEDHDIVYRAAAQPGDPVPPPTPALQDATWRRTIVPDDVLLFRYSALTFNGHRIHYDRDYVTKVEGYPGLIFHGPMQAALLVEFAAHLHGGIAPKRFSYRGLQPLFEGGEFSVNANEIPEGLDIWIANTDGAPTMRGTASW